MAILGPDGTPVSQPPAAAPAGSEAPVPMEPRIVGLKDGPLLVQTKVTFTDVQIGGDRAKFEQAIDAVLNRCSSLSVRLIELMLLGAQKRVSVSPFVIGALEDVLLMRTGVEGIMARITQGLDPLPRVQVAQKAPPP